MSASTLRATMERRLLVNYRVDPQALAGVLPKPFRPCSRQEGEAEAWRGAPG